MASAPTRMEQSELGNIFNNLKPKQSVSVWFNSVVRSADSWTELQVGRKSKSKKYNLEKISLIHPDNPKGSKYYLYNRQGRISFAMGDMGTSLIAIKTHGKNAESFEADYNVPNPKVMPSFMGSFAKMSKKNQQGDMQRRLDGIWRKGDRDEGSIKHIYYSLGALGEGRDWHTQTDYGFEMNKIDMVQRMWWPIQAIRDEVGLEAFKELVASTPNYGEAFEQYEYTFPNGEVLKGDGWVNYKSESFGAEDDCREAKEEVKKLRRKIALLDILHDRENSFSLKQGFSRKMILKGLFSEKDLEDYEYRRLRLGANFSAESFAADARELYKTDPKELLELAKNEGLECVYCEGSSFHDPFATPYSKATGGATIYYPCDCGETQVVITDKKWGAESFAAEWLSRPIYNSCKNPNCDEMVVYHKEADIGKNCDKCIAITLYGKNQVCSVCKVKPIWDEGTDLCEGCSNNPELHNAESFSADSQTRVYRNLGIGAALVAGLAYWIKR